jgi:hypothetical protein
MGMNHFGAEHKGMTAYGALFDVSGATHVQVGSIYSTPMTAMGFCKWTWMNALTSGHKYVIAIFADPAMTNPSCKPGDAGWLFPLSPTNPAMIQAYPADMGKAVTGDATFTFPTGHAPRSDATKCSWFPATVMGAVSVVAP